MTQAESTDLCRSVSRSPGGLQRAAFLLVRVAPGPSCLLGVSALLGCTPKPFFLAVCVGLLSAVLGGYGLSSAPIFALGVRTAAAGFAFTHFTQVPARQSF